MALTLKGWASCISKCWPHALVDELPDARRFQHELRFLEPVEEAVLRFQRRIEALVRQLVPLIVHHAGLTELFTNNYQMLSWPPRLSFVGKFEMRRDHFGILLFSFLLNAINLFIAEVKLRGYLSSSLRVSFDESCHELSLLSFLGLFLARARSPKVRQERDPFLIS